MKKRKIGKINILTSKDYKINLSIAFLIKFIFYNLTWDTKCAVGISRGYREQYFIAFVTVIQNETTFWLNSYFGLIFQTQFLRY